MIRLAGAAIAIALASAAAGAAFAQTPPLVAKPPSGWQRAAGIRGTLDPASGVFTPDRPTPNTGSSHLAGQIDFVFNLDAANAKSVSVACVVTILFFLKNPDGLHIGASNPTGFFLDYDQKNDRFVGSLPVDFSVYADAAGNFSATYEVECRYTFDPQTQSFYDDGVIEVVGDSNLVPVQGAMNGQHY